MVTTNSIALTATGIVGYDGATFTATPVTNSNVLIGGGGSQTVANVAPPGNVGTPLISNGIVGSAPVFGTAQVRGGGTGLSILTVNQIMLSGSTTTGDMQQLPYGNNGQVLMSNGSGIVPSWTSASLIRSWIDQGVNTGLASGFGYFCTASITITLPLSPSQSDMISVFNDFGASVVIQANTGQTIRLTSSNSSSGGTATSAAQGDCLTLVYRAATTTWNAVSSEGTWVLA